MVPSFPKVQRAPWLPHVTLQAKVWLLQNSIQYMSCQQHSKEATAASETEALERADAKAYRIMF
jgi:hypothetical protein